MKRGTPDHPKVAHLAALLNIPVYSAVGLLELLWHFTARFAPQGDIGRYSDEAIARALHWERPTGERGVKPECRLSDALVAAKWLDRCAKHRLVVHDWPDHADQAVTKFLSRHSLDFVRTESSLPLPEPEPEPSTPSCTSNGHLSKERIESVNGARVLIHFLNETAARRYRETPQNLKLISARLEEVKSDVDGVKRMIVRQCALWGKDPKMSEHLTPDTLFRKSNFGKYYDNRDFPIPGQTTNPNPQTYFNDLSPKTTKPPAA